MKFLAVFALCIMAVVNAGDEFSPQFKEKLINKVQEVGAKCAEQEKATGEDIGQLMSRQPPTRKEGKCLIACFNQAFGGQDKDGKFTKDGIAKSLEPFKKENEGVYNKLVKLMDDCMPEVKSADRCDAAAEMAHCFNTKADAAGLTADMIM